MACSSGKCFDITPCPAPVTSGSWGVFDVAYNYENEGEGFWAGTLDQPPRIVLLADKSAFLTVEPQRNRVQKFNAYTYEFIEVMSAAPISTSNPPNSTAPAGSGDGEFSEPKDILLSVDGSEAYVADIGNSRITVIDPIAWTVLRQIPFDLQDPNLELARDFRAMVLDPAGNRVLLLVRDASHQSKTAILRSVPLDGSPQTTQTLTWEEYHSITASKDGSRYYIGGSGAVAILDATFQQVAIRGTFTTDSNAVSCVDGFGSIMFASGSMNVDDDGNLWVGDYRCRLVSQWDVSNDAFSLVTWFGGGDEFEPIAPVIRADGVLLFWNYDSSVNQMMVRCRNLNVPDGQPFRSATLRRARRRD
jgi:DNA-binding beta-propeller fold protein YncE